MYGWGLKQCRIQIFQRSPLVCAQSVQYVWKQGQPTYGECLLGRPVIIVSFVK